MAEMCGRRIRSGDVIINFVKHRMRQMGYDGSRAGDAIRYLYAQSPYEESTIVSEIVAVANKLDSNLDHRSFMVNTVATVDLYGQNAQRNYIYTLNQMFTDGQITWGRLFMVMIYTGELVLEAVRHCQHARAVQIIDWCTEFLNQPSVLQWLNANGGWDSAPDSEKLIDRRADHRAAQSVACVPTRAAQIPTDSVSQKDEVGEVEERNVQKTEQIAKYLEEMTPEMHTLEKIMLTFLSLGTVAAAGISVLHGN